MNKQEHFLEEMYQAPAMSEEEYAAAQAITPDLDFPVSGDRMAYLGLK